ncbi:MAG: hypothetical protein IJD45_01225 [Clostridia bacterium]|nr:hypothetical protein [Clostridia bacterium]
MKKILAVLLAVIMLFSVTTLSSSAAGETAKVSIVTNKGSAVEEGTKTYFTVRFDNFDTVKAVDVTVTAEQGTTLGEVKAYNFREEVAQENVTYTKTGNTIRFVDLLEENVTSARLVIATTASNESATITVTGSAAESGTVLFQLTSAEGTVEVKTAVNETTIKQSTTDFTPPVSNTTFTPAGGVYSEVTGEDNKTTYVYANKNENGTFSFENAVNKYVYQTFDKPENGITTFGLSNDLNHPALLRFGNFSNLYNATNENLEHGTMIFEGDWLELKHYYIALGYEVKDFVKALYNNASAILNKPENIANGITHVYYNVPKSDGGTTTVNLYLFKQKNYMWKDEDNNILEYTVRLHGAQKDVRYTGIAYSVDNGVVTISENAKSIVATETDVVS